MKLPDHLSASSINTFYQCPFKKYCDYEKKTQLTTDRTSADFGLAIHRIIPNYYDLIEDFPRKDEMLEAVEIAFSEGGNYATSSKSTKMKRVKRNFENWEIKRIKSQMKKPKITEKKFKVEIYDDLPKFELIPDAYFGVENMVVDWKTGNSLQMDNQTIIQGLTYVLGLESSGYDVDKVLFVDLAKGRELPMPKVSKGFLYSKAKQMCDMIEVDRFPTKPSYLCNYCEYKLVCDLKDFCPLGEIV